MRSFRNLSVFLMSAALLAGASPSLAFSRGDVRMLGTCQQNRLGSLHDENGRLIDNSMQADPPTLGQGLTGPGAPNSGIGGLGSMSGSGFGNYGAGSVGQPGPGGLGSLRTGGIGPQPARPR